MNKILVDYRLLDFNNPESRKLIFALRLLTDSGYRIIIDKKSTEINSSMKSILENEEIRLNYIDSMKIDKQEDIIKIGTTKSSFNPDIVISESTNLKNIYDAAVQVISRERKAVRKRKTKETDIFAEVNLDGNGISQINTGIGFFDHMLEQIARHGNVDLSIKVTGDLHVDEHHTVEDVGITMGECMLDALGDKKGIKRYGFMLPMDDSVARCAIDFGGRPFLNFKCKFKREKVGEFPTELVAEFFRGLSTGMKANIYLRAKGDNDHHKIEAMFKAFAKALNEACMIDERNKNKLPSTKGLL